MRKSFIAILSLLIWGSLLQAQTNFLVSCPSELKLNGKQNYFFVSKHSYLLYDSNTSILKLVINMYRLDIQNSNTVFPGQNVTYNTNIYDSNSFVFEGLVPENKIRPQSDLKDTYTFSITGTVKYRDISYTTMVICSYGERMLRNTAQTAINLNLEMEKMDDPMYIPLMNEMIDNIKIEVIDGTVNMVHD